MKKIIILLALAVVSVMAKAQTNQKQNAQTITFQNVKMKAYSGDSVSFDMAKINVPENRTNSKTIVIAFYTSALHFHNQDKWHHKPVHDQ